MLELLSRPESWIAIATLTALEVVLGIDNLVFIAVLAGRLPEQQRSLARRVGLGAALVTRLALLFTLSWLMRLDKTLFEVMSFDVTGRSLVLLAGGLFLMGKATVEIYHKTEATEEEVEIYAKAAAGAFGAVIVQIAIIDIVFSLDSIITAVGMVDHLSLMVIAVVIAMAFMILAADMVAGFIDKHPSLKILALSFLMLIGALLVAEAMGQHLQKGYIYFAMAFSLFVELLNMRYRANRAKKRQARAEAARAEA